MSLISSVDTTFYPGLVEGFIPKTTLPIPAVQTEQTSSEAEYYQNLEEYYSSDIDLSNYYEEVKPTDLLTKVGKNLVESAQTFDNTMVTALHNGYSVQDVCNIRLAEMAYKANAYVFDIASELSTFEVDV